MKKKWWLWWKWWYYGFMTFMKLRWFIAQRAAVASISSPAVHQAWWSQEEKITCSLKFFLATWRRFTRTTAFALAASWFHFHIRFQVFDHFITRESGWAGFDPKVACEGGGGGEGGDEDGQQLLGLDSNPHLLCLLPPLEFRRKISQCRHPFIMFISTTLQLTGFRDIFRIK